MKEMKNLLHDCELYTRKASKLIRNNNCSNTKKNVKRRNEIMQFSRSSLPQRTDDSNMGTAQPQSRDGHKSPLDSLSISFSLPSKKKCEWTFNRLA